MTQSIKLLLAGCILMAATGVANAETGKSYIPPQNRDVVRDSNGSPVHSTNGECVRTYWESGCDPCGKKVEYVKPALTQEERTVYFDFNKSTLTNEGKVKLNSLATELKSRGKIKSVRIAGFADRIGSAAANEKLSKKRADSVRKYLVSQGIVNAQVVETRWFGDSVSATNCPKSLSREKLISCLRKDRRVEVEVDYAPMAKY